MRSVQIASLKLTKKWKYLKCKNHRLVLYKYGYETSQSIEAYQPPVLDKTESINMSAPENKDPETIWPGLEAEV